MRNMNIFLLASLAILGAATLLGHVDPLSAGIGVVALGVVQTTYSETMPIGFPGMVADMSTYDGDARICETDAGIGFGLACSQGTADNGAVLGGASAAVFVGISVRDITLVGETVDEYPDNAMMAVMTRGDMWVTVGGDVTKGGDVTFNSTTGVLSSAGTSGTQFAIAGARWMTSASSGGLAKVRLGGALPSA